MKHNSSIEFTECMGVQITHSIHPNITKEDIDIIVEEPLRAEIRHNIETIKRYIDGGKPVLKS